MRTDGPATTTHATYTEGDHLLSWRAEGRDQGESLEEEEEEVEYMQGKEKYNGARE